MGFLMQFGKENVEKAMKEAEQELSTLDKISKNQLYEHFSFYFIK